MQSEEGAQTRLKSTQPRSWLSACHPVPPVVSGEDPFMDGATVLTPLLVSLIRALNRETASAARLLASIVRPAVSRALSTFGESAASMRRQVLALMTTQQSDSLSSFRISVFRPCVVTLWREGDSGRSSGCDNEF